jgi:DNA-binding transcriptional MerR regulator
MFNFAEKLLNMTIYPVSQVESMTGIKAHTLRIWERRYQFLKPQRTETNIRYYSDEQLKKLINISILNRNGYRISKLDKMTEEDIHNKVSDILNDSDKSLEDDIQGLTLAMLEMDEEKFNQIYQGHIIRKGLLRTITDVIYPFLTHVGVLWITNKTYPAQEHFITNLVRQKIISAIESYTRVPDGAPSIVLFLPDGENHEIGLLLSSFVARDLGWKVYYLGQNVPREDIEDVVELVQPKALMTMLLAPRKDTRELIGELVQCVNNIPLFMTGNPSFFEDIKSKGSIIFVNNPRQLEVELDKLSSWN